MEQDSIDEGRQKESEHQRTSSHHEKATKELQEQYIQLEQVVEKRTAGLNLALDQLQSTVEELRVTEEELREQNEELIASRNSLENERQKYLELFELAPDGYIITDASGMVTDANRGAIHLLNTSKKFLVGRAFLSFVPKQEQGFFLSHLSRVFRVKEKRPFGLPLKPRGKKPMIYTEVSASVIRNQEGHPAGVRWLLRDLTDQKKAEQNLKDSEARYKLLSEQLEETVERKVEELQQAKSLASIGRMVSVVAHEIRNPLQAIQLGVEALKQLGGHQKNKSEIMEEITYGVEMVNRITSELLEYARPLQLHRTSISIEGLIERALKHIIPRLYNVNIYADFESEEEIVNVDVPKLTQVLIHLLHNAADAMPGGGTLTIGSRFSKGTSGQIVNISISDTGCGINETDLEQVYEPFFTTKTRGIGLGIPFCKKIVKAHNGNMSMQSKKNEGTIVNISLPVGDDDA